MVPFLIQIANDDLGVNLFEAAWRSSPQCLCHGGSVGQGGQLLLQAWLEGLSLALGAVAGSHVEFAMNFPLVRGPHCYQLLERLKLM